MNNTDKQSILDKRYLRMAAIWAENSYCQRRKVGAILVKDKMIISDGFMCPAITRDIVAASIPTARAKRD